MGFLETVFGAEESRTSTLANPSPTLRDAFGAGKTLSGVSVSIDNAMTLVPLFSGVSLISGAIGSLPLVVYKRTDEGRERASSHRTYGLLHTQPNPEMAADELWEIVGEHLNLWGNAFLWKPRNSLGQVAELWPLKPSRMQVGRDKDGRRLFIVDGNVDAPYTETDILHIRGLSADGLVGYSPVQLARQTIGNALAQGEFQSKFLGSDGKPAILLRHPNELKPEAAARLKASWDGVKAGGTVVLEENIAVERWTMPLEDAQFIEQMQFSDLRIAQLLNLPPWFLGAPTGDSTTYSNTEQQGLQFITYTLRRWLVRIEGSLLRDPSIFLQGSRFFPEFLVDGLLRADSNSRAAFYTAALAAEGGWMNRAEVRERENLPSEGERSEGV
ncbi:MAG: phage portal protein [Desulfurellales bacterium]|nr:MAG: phage portal protein [Desulfurellales bacterium]